jgi:hypothetical protein
MTRFEIALLFDVGDPETVALVTIHRDDADGAAVLADTLRTLASREGFGAADLVQVVITRVGHAVNPNLLYQPAPAPRPQ